MTLEMIARQGLALIGDEAKFRQWAAKWFPGIIETVVRGAPSPVYMQITFQLSLEVWAFRARDEAVKARLFGVACFEVWRALDPANARPEHANHWGLQDATPYHWIIAGCLAKEIQRSADRG